MDSEIIEGIINKYETAYKKTIEWAGPIDLNHVNVMTLILLHELRNEPTIKNKFHYEIAVVTIKDTLEVHIFPKIIIINTTKKNEEYVIDIFTTFRNISYTPTSVEENNGEYKQNVIQYDIIKNKNNIADVKSRIKFKFRIKSFNKIDINKIRSSSFIIDRFISLIN